VIVVGVDGSEASKRALRWAFDEARLRHTPLHAVYAWHAPEVGGRNYIPPDLLDPSRLRGKAEEILDRAVAEIANGDAGVEVERVVAEGRAARVLREAAEGAELLVVGSRGHGGFTAILLDSVSRHCAHDAPCPVVIVRRREAADGALATG
jgi:nucleotide-binding universal stress UspA family protein